MCSHELKEDHVRDIGRSQLPAREKAQNGSFPHSPSKGTNHAGILNLASGLQNLETIHFCCLSLPVCDTLLWQL